MKLSEAIRKGIPFVQNMGIWLVGNFGCALGTALYAVGHRDIVHHEEVYRLIEKEFGVKKELSREISMKHSGGMSREAIADWVEREYESKLPQKERESDAAYSKRMIEQIVAGADKVVA